MKVATRFISISEKEQSSLKQLNQRHPLNRVRKRAQGIFLMLLSLVLTVFVET